MNAKSARPSTLQTRAVEQAIRDRELLEQFELMEGTDDGSGRATLEAYAEQSEGIYRVTMNPRNPERWGSIQPCDFGQGESKNAVPPAR